MTRPGEEGFYSSDRPIREEPQHGPTKTPGWVALAVICPLVFALGLATGVLLSLVVLGWGIA
jgi:hypothetical protein